MLHNIPPQNKTLPGMQKSRKIWCRVQGKLVNKDRPKRNPNVETQRQGLYTNYDTYFKVFAGRDGQAFAGKDGRVLSDIDILFFNFFLTFIHPWERGGAWAEGRRGRERGRHRIRSRLQAPSCQHPAQCGAGTHQPWDHDLSWSQTLNRQSHPGAL